MECRPNCGACCIAPSITSTIPEMEKGKPAGVRCIQLDENNMCKIFKNPKRPKVCCELSPCKDMCGRSREEAIKYLTELEKETSPNN
ncbi:MAG: YkgJ family cysteine cluster protein [Romboutsia sp.]|uniref:YkgJ family cysteine cluster protein n=1 Tax=Romboutsia sp. TaxID=1965302 RepID=UPI003F2D6429